MIRKIMLVMVMIPMVFLSCKSQKGVPSTKGTAADQKTINGAWTLNEVSYEGNTGTFKSVLFNDADASCFAGSSWYFRNNNNTGSYTLANKTDCSAGERFIRWSILNTNQLQFKFIDEKYKDISGGLGYRMTIATLTDQEMILKSNVSVDGESIIVVYNFTKN
ncbi:MAG: lipocalin family protein [Maribacter sp.]|nr:lipocalin family protein [Maribacter sp.]